MRRLLNTFYYARQDKKDKSEKKEKKEKKVRGEQSGIGYRRARAFPIDRVLRV